MKTIVVPVGGDATDRPVFETALRLAGAFEAHLVFLHAREDVVQMISTMVAGQVDGPIGLEQARVDLEREAGERAVRARQSVEALCAERQVTLSVGGQGSGVSAEWASVTGVLGDVLVAWARTADLIVMGRNDLGDVLSHVVVECGRPVLFTPASPAAAPPDLFDHVAIAWNDTAEAARAVAAVTPLLAKARTVAIMTVADAPDEVAQHSAARLAATLRRHGPSVAALVFRAEEASAGEALLLAAQEAGASLLVMGGFNHSRLRELVFGGFTRDMLESATMPVLIAH